MSTPSQRPGYFDALYAADPDPWGFETRSYEAEKYACTMDALPQPRFAAGLEVGCSIGVLTALLGTRCDALLGIDIADAALARAQHRCRAMPGVQFARSKLPQAAPKGPFDLIVLSEVLYYFNPAEVAETAARLEAELAHDGSIVLVHWLGPTPDYPMTGHAAVATFERALPGLRPITCRQTKDYRLDVLVRSGR